MNEYIERVASAIIKAQNDWEMGILHPLAEGSVAHQQAVYAIEAMREPTEQMITRGYFETSEEVEDVWKGMIDEALGIPETPHPVQKPMSSAEFDAYIEDGKEYADAKLFMNMPFYKL